MPVRPYRILATVSRAPIVLTIDGLQRALDAPDRRRHAARRSRANPRSVRRRAPKIVSSVVFFTRLPRPRSNRRVTGAVAGSLTALGTRATVSGTIALVMSTLLGHV
jgi:hypothetical protein